MKPNTNNNHGRFILMAAFILTTTLFGMNKVQAQNNFDCRVRVYR